MFARTRFLPFVLALLLGPAGLAGGADAPPAPLTTGVRAAVEVTAMDLDVVATKDGRPVTDLTKEDFLSLIHI